MRSDRIVACVTWSAVSLAVLGCSPAPAPPFADTTGEAAHRLAYPAGPYGVGVGSTIADLDFIGYGDAKKTTATTQTISLADFYNPHGRDKAYQPPAGAPDDRLFPSGSGYAGAGKPKPTVLLVDIAATWCGPCNQEAATILPQKHARYAPCGGEFLLDLRDGVTPGTAATPQDLRDWTTKYQVDYPAAIDPAYRLDALFQAVAYPNNMLIDTTTMKIVDVVAGEVVVGTCSDVFVCTTDADCALCLLSGTCASGKACTTDADCKAETCKPLQFWTEYEAHLDKSRPGCGL